MGKGNIGRWRPHAERAGRLFGGRGGREVEILKMKTRIIEKKENTKYRCRVAVVARESQGGRSTPKPIQ